MVVTSEVHLPEESELTVQEVNLSGSTLIASSFHLGKYCEHANNEFMLCRMEENDARKCVNEGKAVTACTMDFFRKVKRSCMSEFNQYAHCVDKSSGDYSFKNTMSLASVRCEVCVGQNGALRYCEYFDVITPEPRPEPTRTPHRTAAPPAKFCRKTQGVLDTCMLEKLNIERPSFGYFTEARVHDTKRPKPLPEPKAVYPDATPALPDDAERKPARLGSRFYWMTE